MIISHISVFVCFLIIFIILFLFFYLFIFNYYVKFAIESYLRNQLIRHRTKLQTMIYTTLHIKVKMEQHKFYFKKKPVDLKYGAHDAFLEVQNWKFGKPNNLKTWEQY